MVTLNAEKTKNKYIHTIMSGAHTYDEVKIRSYFLFSNDYLL